MSLTGRVAIMVFVVPILVGGLLALTMRVPEMLLTAGGVTGWPLWTIVSVGGLAGLAVAFVLCRRLWRGLPAGDEVERS